MLTRTISNCSYLIPHYYYSRGFQTFFLATQISASKSYTRPKTETKCYLLYRGELLSFIDLINVRCCLAYLIWVFYNTFQQLILTSFVCKQASSERDKKRSFSLSFSLPKISFWPRFENVIHIFDCC